MQAARASEDPVTIASGARIVTHALMGASTTRQRSTWRALWPPSSTTTVGPRFRVFVGLRLAPVAGRGSRRPAREPRRPGELLTEAAGAAVRLGDDLNLRWTAFGPTNASLHRVNIAVTLRDAGTPIDVARTVDLGRIGVTQRKACFLMDTARAFLQCGRHERAYLALRAAEEIAPRRSPAAAQPAAWSAV
jgi:hypothetical protein